MMGIIKKVKDWIRKRIISPDGYMNASLLISLREVARELFTIEPVYDGDDRWDESFQIMYDGKYNVLVVYNDVGIAVDWIMSPSIKKTYKTEQKALRDLGELRRLYILREVKKLRKERNGKRKDK